jgi:hypothetical protein
MLRTLRARRNSPNNFGQLNHTQRGPTGQIVPRTNRDIRHDLTRWLGSLNLCHHWLRWGAMVSNSAQGWAQTFTQGA